MGVVSAVARQKGAEEMGGWEVGTDKASAIDGE
jgi:hypothetical protein